MTESDDVIDRSDNKKKGKKLKRNQDEQNIKNLHQEELAEKVLIISYIIQFKFSERFFWPLKLLPLPLEQWE